MIEKNNKSISDIECYLVTNIDGKEHKLLIDLDKTRIRIVHPDPKSISADEIYWVAELIRYYMGRIKHLSHCFLPEETVDLILGYQTPQEKSLEKEQEKYFEWKRKNKIIN